MSLKRKTHTCLYGDKDTQKEMKIVLRLPISRLPGNCFVTIIVLLLLIYTQRYMPFIVMKIGATKNQMICMISGMLLMLYQDTIVFSQKENWQMCSIIGWSS